jgi:tetratricopeptide (TPR) repeat protein
VSSTSAGGQHSGQGEDRPASSVLSGSAANAVVAGAIDGGIHFHESGRRSRRPWQVPRAISDFVNQERALGEIADAGTITPRGEFRDSLVLVTGTAGVGKTSLAVRWAQVNAGLFPDGQLYINMRGFDSAAPVQPLDALARLLPALDVPAGAIPDDLEAAAARLRTELADRQLLILLDNVATVAQVRPLLPGTGRCMLLATSRNSLSGLVTRDGARRVALPLFSPEHATQLLQALLSRYRAADDEEGLAELAELCARLPLALRVAAERAIERPGDSLGDLVRELRTESSLWGALSDDEEEEDGDSIRAVFTWSYRALSVSAAQMFRLLGLHPGQEISADTAAALAGIPVAAARADLNRLVAAHMVESVTRDRYQLHDLLRAYAVDRQAEANSEEGTAVNREVAWYAHSAANAVAAVQQLFGAVDLDPLPDGCTPATFDSREAAVNWYRAERDNLRSASALAAQYGLRRWTWQLPIALAPIHHATRSSFRDWLVMAEYGLATAREDGEAAALATLLTTRGVVFTEQTPRRLDEAARDLEEALAINQDRGDRAAEVRAANALGWVALRRRRLREAAARFDQVHRLGEQLPTGPWAAVGLENGANVYCELAEYARAGELITRALDTFAALIARGRYQADPRLEFEMRLTAARVHRSTGQLDEASLTVKRVTEIAEAQGGQAGYLMWARLEAGRVELAQGNATGARVALLDAVRECRVVGDHALEAEALYALGDSYRVLGDNRQAEGFYLAAAHGFAAAQEPWREAASRARLADCLADDGHDDTAQAERLAAIALLGDYDDPGLGPLRRELASHLAA